MRSTRQSKVKVEPNYDEDIEDEEDEEVEVEEETSSEGLCISKDSTC